MANMHAEDDRMRKSLARELEQVAAYLLMGDVSRSVHWIDEVQERVHEWVRTREESSAPAGSRNWYRMIAGLDASAACEIPSADQTALITHWIAKQDPERSAEICKILSPTSDGATGADIYADFLRDGPVLVDVGHVTERPMRDTNLSDLMSGRIAGL